MNVLFSSKPLPLLIISALLCSAASAAETTVTSASDRLSEVLRVERQSNHDQIPEDQRNRLIVFTYDKLFAYGPAAIAGMSVDDLRSAFTASYYAAFYGTDHRHVLEMARYLDALDAAGAAQGPDYIKMNQMFIAARMFDEANDLKVKHSALDLERAPSIVVGGRQERVHKPSKLVINPDGASLTYQPVSLRGKTLVVLAHPLCHFSVGAITAISAQGDLSEIFKNAIWLAPPSQSLNIREIQAWNVSHPDATLAFMDQKDDWPMFDAWATPTFYFLSDGKVVEKVQGWPPAIGMDGLHQAVARWKAAP